MYSYCALINALSAHMIHINLNMIFYTHVEHSPIKNNLRKVLHGNTQTQTHTDTQTHRHTHTHTHTHARTHAHTHLSLIHI